VIPVAAARAFQCPSDCGYCCTHLKRDLPRDEQRAQSAFRAWMRDLGVYSCGDAVTTGLALSPEEAEGLRAEAARRGIRVRLHPRTYLLETRRRLAVVLEWHLAHEECPFYADYKCTAYDLRPLVCRAFPVMAPAPAWRLAPSCPKTDETQALAGAKAVRLGTYLGAENRARRAVEARHADLDDVALRLLDAPGARFAKGLSMREAAGRLRRYRFVAPDAL
jgi:Fe-S-cluster containining protein